MGDSLEEKKAANGETVNRVKMLQAQLKELSQATEKKDNYMDEIKKATGGVKARIAAYEGNIKSSPSNSVAPMPNQNGVWQKKANSPSSRNGSTSKPESRPVSSKSGMGSPNTVVQLPDDSKEVKVLTSPGLGKMVYYNETSPAVPQPKKEEAHLLRPSMAKRMAYNHMTKQSFGDRKLTVDGMTSSLVSRKRVEKE